MRDSIAQRAASVAVIWHAANALDSLTHADAVALIFAAGRGESESRADDLANALRWALAELAEAQRALDRALPPPRRRRP